MKRMILILFALVQLSSMCLWAQEGISDSLGRLNYHVNIGTGVSAGFGATTVYTAVAPSISYQVSDKLQLKAGFEMVNSIDPNYFSSRTSMQRSLAPRRNSSTAVAARLAMQYQVNDHLWLAGSVFHVGGQAILPGGLTFWGAVPGGLTMDMDVTGVNAHMRYKFGNGNTLGVQLSYIQDRTGALFPLLYSPFYSGGPWGVADELNNPYGMSPLF